jgi:hypothetical protein
MNIRRFNRKKIDEPEIGDYVVVNLKNSTIGNLLSNSIGQIIKQNAKLYRVMYGTTDWVINRNEIEYFSKDKEDLEYILAAKKYNL